MNLKENKKVIEFGGSINLSSDYLKVRKLLKNKIYDESKEILDKMLLTLAILTDDNIKEYDEISIDLWKDRVWLHLEKYNLLN